MTQSQLPHGEAWLLEIAVRFDLAVASLTSPNLCEWLNCGSHNLAPRELYQTLSRMFDSGDIEAYYSHAISDSTATFFCPSDGQLDAAVSGRDERLRYRLTQQGASRWEALANPNWTRYFTDCGWTGADVEITAGSRERLHELVENSETLWDVVMPKSGIIVEVLRPWTITHWKVLPEGFRAEVPYTEIALSMEDFLRSHAALERSSELHRREYNRLRHWADSICGCPYV